MHFHLHYEINCVTKGKLSVINNGMSVECSAPFILIHAPCSFHDVISDKSLPYERYKFHFNDAYINKYNPNALLPDGLFSRSFSVIPLSGEASEVILSYLALFRKNCGDTEVNNRYFAYLLDLIIRYYDARLVLETNNVDKNNLGYIGEVLVYISENYSEAMNIESLAAKFFVSKAKINRDFKALIGTTLKQHIIDVRISNAMRILTGGESVAETAH